MYSNKLICEILDYIDINLNRKITINELEKHFFYNKYYIMKLFKKEIDLTIFDYINKLRIYHSINEIKNTDNSFTLISMNNGFYSLEYFSETFKQITGVNPRTFKKFWTYHSNITKKDEATIRNTLISLQTFNDKTNKYRKNLKPSKPQIRKLTIFK